MSIKKKVKEKKHWTKKRNLWTINFKSSNLKIVAYYLAKQTLYIQFDTGAEYKYKQVPIQWFVDFTLAESKGKYFAKAKYELENMEKLL